VGTVIAAATRVYVSQRAAVLTPLCSCGTMAVILAMLASVVPWGPIVAFIVASPLTSPAEVFYLAGFLGWKFAGFHLLASTTIGLAAGVIADRLDRAGWLAGQARYQPSEPQGDPARGEAAAAAVRTSGDGFRLGVLLRESVLTAYRLVPRWVAFAAIGYGVLYAIPPGLTERLMGSRHAWSVPAAALLGLPLYINTESAVPRQELRPWLMNTTVAYLNGWEPSWCG